METQDVDQAAALLLQHPAEDSPLSLVRDRDGQPLVVLAIYLNQPQVLDLLLSYGCASEPVQRGDDDDDDDDMDDDDDNNVYHGCTPLCLAVQLGHADCARVLMAHGASVDTPSRDDSTLQTPIHVLAAYNRTTSFYRNEMLVASLALDARDMGDSTPLHLAVTYDAQDAARSLVDAGADVRAADAGRSTPLHIAAANAREALATLCLGRGVDVDARDAQGNTPLLEAAFAGQHAMQRGAGDDPARRAQSVNLLLQHGSDGDAQNRDGNTALIGAVWNGYADAVEALVNTGASGLKQNRRGETVLHVAARAGITSVAIWHKLVGAGADVRVRDSDGRTCYDIWVARLEPHEERAGGIASLLKRIGRNSVVQQCV